jgi:hypothetical protein
MKEIQHVFRNYHSAALSTRRKILSATVMALASFRLATVRVTTGYNKSQLSLVGFNYVTETNVLLETENIMKCRFINDIKIFRWRAEL